jgi:hypothetical protein
MSTSARHTCRSLKYSSNRIAPPTMQQRHRSGQHRAPTRGEPTSLDEVESFVQLVDKTGELQKIIAVVRIAHDDESAAGRRHTPIRVLS